MKFMTDEQRHKYPALAWLSRQCQSYVRAKGGCNGCDQMVSGCEDVLKPEAKTRLEAMKK